jgi:hypothetical protein
MSFLLGSQEWTNRSKLGGFSPHILLYTWDFQCRLIWGILSDPDPGASRAQPNQAKCYADPCGFWTAKLHNNINHEQAYPGDSWRRGFAPGCWVAGKWAAVVRRHPRSAAPRPQAPLPRSGSWALCCPASRHSTRRRTPCRQLESWTRSRFMNILDKLKLLCISV